MYMGIDLGTSGVKVIITDSQGNIVDSASASISVSRPQPLWSEQDPAQWWAATNEAVLALGEKLDLQQVKALGIAGQMHGATLLDASNQVIRPAILWNDGRCEAQCREIETMVSNSREITGNIMMPGFTAPKLLWVKQHEPDNFARIAKVLLPKDYLRFLLSGDFVSDMSDAAGTLWMDVEKRAWHPALVAACGLSVSQMPSLCEGNDISGKLNTDIAQTWGMQAVPIVGGAGDNAAGAIGVGIVKPGQAMLSLGTSGVYFMVSDGFESNPDSAVHSFCHALPKTWHLMSVMLSAGSCLQWYADNIAKVPVEQLLAELDSAKIDPSNTGGAYFLPYLSGERTPHNNPEATGSFFGLTHSTTQAQLTHAVIEGVSFAFADALDALHSASSSKLASANSISSDEDSSNKKHIEQNKNTNEITLIGGGAKSPYWRQLLANVLGRTLTFRAGGEVGPSLGAARLAQMAIETERSMEEICPMPHLVEEHAADPSIHQKLQARRKVFQALYAETNKLV